MSGNLPSDNVPQYRGDATAVKFGGQLVRPATFADYPAVLAIDEMLYDGMDYMKTMYFQFLHDRRHVVIVVERDGKLIALVNYRFHNQHLITGMSGRIALSHRGQGNFKQNKDEFRDTFHRAFPSITHELFINRKLKHLNPETYTSLYEWNSIMLKFNALTLHESLNRRGKPLQQFHLPLELSYQQTVTLLQQSDHMERFIRQHCTDYVPGQWNWRPIKINNKNELQELFSTSSKVLVTLEHADYSGNNGKPAEPSFPHGISKITSLSYSAIHPVHIGISCDTFFFGDDESAIPGHVYAHVRHIASIWSGITGFALHVPAGMDVERIRSNLERLLGVVSPPSDHFMKAPFVLGIRSFSPTAKL